MPSVSTAASLLTSGRQVSDLSLEEFVIVIRVVVHNERQSATGQPAPVTSAARNVPTSDGDVDTRSLLVTAAPTTSSAVMPTVASGSGQSHIPLTALVPVQAGELTYGSLGCVCIPGYLCHRLLFGCK